MKLLFVKNQFLQQSHTFRDNRASDRSGGNAGQRNIGITHELNGFQKFRGFRLTTLDAELIANDTARRNMNMSENPPMETKILMEPPPESTRESCSHFGAYLVLASWIFLFTYGLFKFLGEKLDVLALFFYLPFVPIFFWFRTSKPRDRHRTILINTYPLPTVIKEKVREHYSHLSDEHLCLVMLGLRQYFQLCNRSGGAIVSMPSRVVDIAWHEFTLLTRDYEQFCQSAMLRCTMLHCIQYTRADDMLPGAAIADGTKKAWLLACEWEGINQSAPGRLPFLFAIDSALEIPDGFKHTLDNDYATEEIPF